MFYMVVASGEAQRPRVETKNHTLESVIDVGQRISVGHGKFDKKNKRRALNTHVLCSK